MKIRFWMWVFSLVLFASSQTSVYAEDTDIFVGTTAVNTELPNIIFLLDNTSNWSNTAQKLPDNEGNVIEQGAAEVRAIKNALTGLTGLLNVGIMEFVTGTGGANTKGAFIRYDLKELTPDNHEELDDLLDYMFDEIQDPVEKKNSNLPFGYLMHDVYNYLAGLDQSQGGAASPTGILDGGIGDEDGYQVYPTTFESPLGAPDICADTYLIFVTNPNPQGPAADGGKNDTENSDNLTALYDAIDGVAVPAAFQGQDGAALPLRTPLVTEKPVTPEVIGTSAECYQDNKISTCTIDEAADGGLCFGESSTSCYCTDEIDEEESASCGNKKYKRLVEFADTIELVTLGELNYSLGEPLNADDWAQFLFEQGVPIEVTIDGEPVQDRIAVRTTTIDVFNAAQSGDHSALMWSMADVGGGEYFQANSEADILEAVQKTLGDILAKNSAFAAVTLPLSATNRARVENQVYIGMFRPAKGYEPRWWGNLKRYQLALFNNNEIKLADATLSAAVNNETGLITECAQSFWTSDTGKYWQGLGLDPKPESGCLALDPNDLYSDAPDGPLVEKGGVGQQVREGVAGPSRKMYTYNSAVDVDDFTLVVEADKTSLVESTTDPNDVMEYTRGDGPGADEVMAGSGLRPSVHGDVVHSRPLTVTYGDDVFRLFYGANDGMYRAVDPATGVERWALIAPEQMHQMERLYNNYELVEYTGVTKVDGVDYSPKEYFFDGPTGEFTDYAGEDEDNPGALKTAYIYPTQRRGGRMVYGIDVTDPNGPPDLLWRHGCETESGSCTHSDFNNIGQTWSAPQSGYIATYVDGDDNPLPVVFFGGGFDTCLNADVETYPCDSSAKGRGIYLLDAATGARVGPGVFTDSDMGPVVGDVTAADVDFDGYIDFIYALDAKGQLYRVDFATVTAQNPENARIYLESDEWTITKIAASSDTSLRFFNGPVVGTLNARVILTFGSGDRERPLELNYPFANSVQNRMYAVKDDVWIAVSDEPIALEGDTMLKVEPIDPDVDPDDVDLTTLDGWYMELPDRGEQITNPSAIAGGKVFFNSFQPGGDIDDICASPLGIGKAFAVDLFSPVYTEGERITGEGIPIPPVIATATVPPSADDLCEGDDCNWNCDGNGCVCTGADCPNIPPGDLCENGADCDTVTFCIGCKGFEPIEIEPDVDPLRRRIFFTEDFDRDRP